MDSSEQAWLVVVLAGTPASVLLASGLQHFQRFTSFTDAMTAHSLIPTLFVRPVAWAVALVELALPILTGLVIVGSLSPFFILPMTLLYLLFALYATRVQTDEPVPCGCGNDDEFLTFATPLRAVMLGAMSAVAASLLLDLGEPLLVALSSQVPALLFAALVITALGRLIWVLPRALHIPDIPAVTRQSHHQEHAENGVVTSQRGSKR